MNSPTSRRCEHCQHSEWRDKESMNCRVNFTMHLDMITRNMIVQRFDSCEKFVREPGAVDE